MRIIELFAGIGACSTALKRLGKDIEIVDAVEIDKYAMASFNAIHGTNFETQDITVWDKDFKDIDLITHGSPCQDFSVAGKQAGGDIGSGTRSSLMYETIRIVGKIRPKYVLWENVKNILSKKHKHNFDAYLEAMERLGYKSYYQVLNAKDYGIPQNRERVYTISIRNDLNQSYEFELQEKSSNKVIEHNAKAKHQQDLIQDEDGLCRCIPAGTHGSTPHLLKTVVRNFEFPPKENLELKLKDLLEDEVDEKYYLQDTKVDKIVNSDFVQEKKRIQEKDVCDTLLARDYKDPKCVQVANLSGGKWDKINESCRRVYSEEGISPTIHTCQGGNTEPKVATYSPYVNKKYNEFAEKKGYIPEQFNPYNCSEIKNIAPAQTTQCGSTASSATVLLKNNLRIRKLTPKECWRLMGFSDEDFEKAKAIPMSNTQLYKQAGNSICVPVLEKIFKNLFKED